jgi:hypothetical protein
MANPIQTRQNGAGGIALLVLLLGGAGTVGLYFLGRWKAIDAVKSMLTNHGVNFSSIRILDVTPTTESSYVDENGTSHAAPKFRSWKISWVSDGQAGVALGTADRTAVKLPYPRD